jgi:hypothetical protein
MLGTLINSASIILGSILGLMIGSRLSKNITNIIFQALGLVVLLLGITMAIKTSNIMILFFSIVLGSLLGEWIDIDKRLNSMGEKIRKKIKIGNKKFTEGFIAASLLFCIGSLAILGPIQEGLGNGFNILLVKSGLDGFASIAFAATFGIGVIFSFIPVLIYQGSVTLLAYWLHNFLSEVIINELNAVGGLLLIGLSINILEIKKLKVANMLPSLIVVVILAYFFLS